MFTVLGVIGTRPEAIKMAPVVLEFRSRSANVNSVVCVTGQHREMLDQVLEVFGIKPDYDLNVMQPNQTLHELTANLLLGLNRVIAEVRPDWVLAQGDTTTVLAAALAAYYHQVRFGHVEAGLRTGDRYRPFPEEMNRRIADVLADMLFAPTERSRQTLLAEGISPERVVVTGNTVVDALMMIAEQPYDWSAGPLSQVPNDGRLVLVTAHRRESFGAPLREMCMAIRQLALHFVADNVHFVYPVHLNPHVRRPVYDALAGLPNVHLLEPLDYVSFVHLMKRSNLILTDSGGIQEEAPTFGVPVLVMRDTTERPEGIEAGLARLVGTSCERIVAEAAAALHREDNGWVRKSINNPYGDGKAAQRIVSCLLKDGGACNKTTH